MDTLCFGASRILRNLMAPQSQQKPVVEIELEKALEGLCLSMEQFVDMCILCGCDYCGTIRGIGPTRAFQMVKKQGSVDRVVASLDKSKYPMPDPFPYDDARQLFLEPEKAEASTLDEQLKWGEPDEEGIVQFLVHEKSFNEDRVRKQIERVKKARSKGQQGRLESFFKTEPTTKSSSLGKRPEASAKSQPKKKSARRK